MTLIFNRVLEVVDVKWYMLMQNFINLSAAVHELCVNRKTEKNLETMVKVKGAVPQWGLGEVLISQTLAAEPVGGWTTESVTHGQCDARPTVTFPAAERHRPLAVPNYTAW